jgi:ankyrin repeat protein
MRDSETFTLGSVWNITALMCAAAQGHLEIVRLLLNAGASVSAVCSAHKEDGGGGSQALHFAVSGRHLAMTEALLDAGADPNTIGNHGRTPLVMAIYEDDLEGVRLLLKRGAQVNLKSHRKDYEPPLSAAATIKKSDTIHSAKSGGAATLGLTVELRNPEIFKLILAAGADPNEPGVLGQTPLIRLAWQRDVPDEILIPLMEALVKAGARVDHLEQDGGTALLGAVLRNKPQTVKFLAGAGADVNRVYQRGTVLDLNLEDIAHCQRDLHDPAFTGPARQVVERNLQRYQEVSKILLGFGAKRKAELAPTAGRKRHRSPRSR